MRVSPRQKWIPYAFILPFIISFVLFFVVPSVYSFALSFAKYPGYGSVKWIGLRNYQNILQYSRFWAALSRTFFYWLAKFIPVTVVSFLMAVFLHSKLLGASGRFYKPVLFLPQVCAATASALVFMILFANQTGTVNQLFGTDIAWIESPIWSKWVVLAMLCWRGTGWFMVVYLSGLTSISPDIYEAGIIDGASAFRRIIHLTIPLMKQTFLFAFIMDAISSLRMYTEAAVLTSTSAGGIARESAEGVINLLMMNLNSGNFGMASAYGWIIFVVVFIVSMFIFRMMAERKAA